MNELKNTINLWLYVSLAFIGFFKKDLSWLFKFFRVATLIIIVFRLC